MTEAQWERDENRQQYQERIARDTLERYSGSDYRDFQSYLLLTNFPQYVHCFADQRGLPVHEGSMFKVAHSKQEDISILDFKIGSPAAALIIDLCANLPIKASCILGMCGGLRRSFRVGDYFVPIASIRGEGTSDFYFTPDVPALANFVVQKKVTDVLDQQQFPYHIGITHTTNKRFWEFNDDFKERLRSNRAQAIEMECATLFMAGYHHKLPVGALLLISDLPLNVDGVKSKKHSAQIFAEHMPAHVELGVKIMHATADHLSKSEKGVYRGGRKRFEVCEIKPSSPPLNEP